MAKEDERLVSIDPTEVAGGKFSDGVREEISAIIGADYDTAITGAVTATTTAEIATQLPPAISSEVPTAVSADLASRDIGFVDDGGGSGHFTVGGADISGTLVPPAAVWSGVGGRPAILPASAASGISSTDTAALSSAATSASTDKQLAFIPGGSYVLDSAIVLPKKSHWQGAGPERTVLIPASGVHGVQANDGTSQSQYAMLSGFSVEYATAQTRSDTPSAGVDMPGFMLSEVFNILVKNGYYGFRSDPGATNWDSNVFFHTLRATDCWIPFSFMSSGGSGSAFTNLFTTNIGRPSVLRLLECANFSGEFTRINLEHSTVRDCAIYLSGAHDVSFRGLHMEGDSFMGRGNTALDGAMSNCVVRTTGQGIHTFDQWTINTCHFGGLIVVPSGLTLTGTTARASLNLMGFYQKTNGGHGIEVGDSIYVEGADTSTSNAYNGAQTVTAVGSDWVEFTVAGTPASPADVDSGSDCITVSLGNSAFSAVHLFKGEGAAGQVRVGSLHMRDIRVIGHTAARRQSMLRVANPNSTPLAVYIDKISFASERSTESMWRETARISGVSRSSNVTTFYFERPHNLHTTSVLHTYGFSNTSFNGVFTGGITPAGRYAVKVANAGSDYGMNAMAGTALLRAYQIASVARSGNYATITTTSDHGLYSSAENGVGLRVAIRADDSSYNTSDALVIDVPSTTTFVIRNVGIDASTTADTGSVMLISGGLSTSSLEEGTTISGAVKCGDFDEYAIIVAPGSIAAGTTVVARTGIVQRADATRDVAEIVSVTTRDGRLNYYAEINTTNQVQIKISNPTAGAITPPNAVVRYRIVRA